nr:hypothetical protein StreXyl84_59400 [Streptomyces sp. Xyl84]
MDRGGGGGGLFELRERVLATGHQVAGEVLASCLAALSGDDRAQLLLLLRRTRPQTAR